MKRTRRRLSPRVAMAASVMLVAAACGRGGGAPDSTAGGAGSRPGDLAAQVASYDLVAGRTGRFMVGVLAGDQSQLVGFGNVSLTFVYLGDRGSTTPVGPTTPPVTARFLPIPGQHIDLAAPGPRFVFASEGIGVYGADGVTFERAGFWQATVTADIDGKRRQATTAFEVLERSPLPAPGDSAPRTDNPIAGAPGVDPKSIDSRAGTEAPIPDPELHRTSIASAIRAARPLMVVISTPTYCQSRFCGPITDSVSALAKRYGDHMDFVHLEVWRDFQNKDLNTAAAEWISPPGVDDAREPWVFVIGRDGRITHRFDNVVTDEELEQAVTEATK